MGRSGIVSLQPGEQLSVRSNYSFLALSWSAFRLDNYFDPLVVMSVARTTPVTSDGQITFDVVLVNIGSAWKISTNNFVAPLVGQYFFSLSSAMSYSLQSEFDFQVNGKTRQGFQAGSTKLMSSGSNDLFSVSCFLKLNAGEKMSISVTFSGIPSIYADSFNYQLSFVGLLYSPPISQQVSFCFFQSLVMAR